MTRKKQRMIIRMVPESFDESGMVFEKEDKSGYETVYGDPIDDFLWESGQVWEKRVSPVALTDEALDRLIISIRSILERWRAKHV